MRWRRVVLSVFALAFLLASSPARAGTCAPGIFPSPATYPFGGNTWLAGVVDIDEDSHPDIVLFSTYSPNAISILYGNGDGTFQPPVAVTLPANTYLLQVFARDVTNDGHADLVVLSYTSSSGYSYTYSILVLRGNGNGTFQPPVSTPATAFGVSLLARLDDDALPDLVTSFGPSLQVFRNLGDGSFQPAVLSSIAAMPMSLIAGDFDEDGHPDLIGIDAGAASLSLFHGLGDGTFVFSSTIASGPVSYIRAADVDGDGHLDLLASLGTNLGVAAGNGNGTFDAFRLYPRRATGAFEVADLDGDGRPDVVSAGWYNPVSQNLVSVLRNVGGGVFGRERAYAWPFSSSFGSPLQLALQDVNDDGRPDLVATDGSTIAVILGDGSGDLDDSFSVVSPFLTLATDMDGDGIADLVTIDGSSVKVYRGLGNADFAAPLTQTVSGGFSLIGIAIADFNGDGHPDVAVTSYYGSGYWVLLGNGDGTLQPPVPYSDFVGGSLYTGDFDGDGKIDLLLGSGSQWMIARGNGDGSFQPATSVPTLPGNLSAIVVSDFNRDGRSDIAGLIATFGSPVLVSVSYSNGDGSFQPAITMPTGSNSSLQLAAGDLNGDLYPDLVVSNSSDNSISVVLSDGAGGFRPAEYFGSGGAASASVVSDLDGDGVPDIAIVSNGYVVILRGLPGGEFAGPQRILTVGTASSISVGDIDGNGTPDLVTGSGWILLNERLAVRVPAAVEICIGSPVVLKANAGGTGAIACQWRKGGVPLSDGSGISGTHTAMLTIAAATAGDAGNYDVVVTDACGTATSSVVSLIVDTTPAAPSITAPKSALALASGLTASVPAAAGHVYEWSIIGGSISSGQGTNQITFAVGAAGTKTMLQVTDHTPGGCASSAGTFVVLADFLDVPPSHPFHSFVVSLARNGITSGCGGGNFCPDSLVTRAQMAVFLLLGEHGGSWVPPPATGTVFTDVPIGSFAAAFIERLAAEAITAGCGAGIYCPGNPVTRAQMAVFLLRAEHGSSYTPPPATGTVFADVPIGSFAAAWIERLAAEGITGGCGGGNFCPGAFATRGQMAVFLTRTFNLP